MTEKNQKSASEAASFGLPSQSEALEQPTKDTEKKVDFSLTNLIDLVKYPVITEKTYLALYKNRQYTFDVDKRLTKTQIKNLFESLFNVNVIAVNTHIPPRRKLRVGMAQGFRPSFKRAIITVKEGQSINYNFSSAQTAN